MTNLIFPLIVTAIQTIEEMNSFLEEANAKQDPDSCEEMSICSEFLGIEVSRLEVLCLAII